MFWGLTPALDLLDEIQPNHKSLPTELNILIIGGCDNRHILQTLARRYRYTKTHLNFYIAEASIETIAKQLLLLNVAFQDPSVLGLTQKTKFFMELYGNSLVRPSVAKFLQNTATQLVKMVTDYDFLSAKMPFIELDIKYKERDYLENLLKFWCGNDSFDICASWDNRLRKFLGARYDSKLGAFDWDLHMRLHSVGAHQICNQEYRNFRLNGVAFNWLESEVSKPNRSMVCVVVPNGEKFLHYGYLGDMQTGPFITYGLKCEDANFLKSTNGTNLYRATDITERNLAQIFYELQNGEPYVHQTTSDLKLGSVVMNLGEKKVVDVKGENSTSSTNKCFALKDTKIKFISITSLALMKHKKEFFELFDLAFFGCFYLKYLDREFVEKILKKNGLLIIENQKFIVNHREKQLKAFDDEIKKTLDGTKLTSLEEFDPCKDEFARFVK